MKAILALEDGSVFHGTGFGAQASACGEVCFNTSMTGYQEILTDPSYKGQIVTMTYPLIGNYGVNLQDVESWRPHAAGFVIRELSPVVSNWRADFSLEKYLEENGIPGIQGIDTRSLTKKLRVRGALNGFISTENISEAEAVKRAKEFVFVGVDYVKEVTHKKAFRWDEKDEQSAAFDLVRGLKNADARNVRKPLPPADIPIVAFDYGMKYNILRRLRQHGFATQVLPATASAADALKHKPAGIFLSNGPGDPAALNYIVREVKTLLDTRHPDFWHLSRPPDSRPGARRKNVQTEIRPSRRQPAGEGFGIRQGGNHLAKSRLRGGRKIVAVRRRGASHQFERPDRRRFAAQDEAGVLRAISSRSLARPARFDAAVRRIPRAD